MKRVTGGCAADDETRFEVERKSPSRVTHFQVLVLTRYAVTLSPHGDALHQFVAGPCERQRAKIVYPTPPQ
jgi:hypothetical protein